LLAKAAVDEQREQQTSCEESLQKAAGECAFITESQPKEEENGSDKTSTLPKRTASGSCF
jgi:hypothetical protein